MRRSRLLALGAVLAVAGGVAVAWHALVTAPPAPPVQVSSASAASARSKMHSLDDAKSRAAQSRQPIMVAETFTDSELSSMANQEAQTRNLPFSNLLLHATGAGVVEGQATVHVAGQDVPVSLEIVPTVTVDSQATSRLVLNVTRVQVGSVPLPGPLTDQVTASVRRSLDVGLVPPGFHDVRVDVTLGKITISGVAVPTG
jgi:hypothetical protein